MNRPRLQIIVASTRPGRLGKPVADWLLGTARAHAGFEVELVDLAEVGLPFMDEPYHPRLARYQHAHTVAWSELVARGDAYVFVTPEYNHSYNAALKNALDYLHREWTHKPAAIVSYGGVSAGTRAALALRQVLTALGMLAVGPAVNVPFVAQFIGDNGAFEANEVTTDAAAVMLDELQRLCDVSTTLRSVVDVPA